MSEKDSSAPSSPILSSRNANRNRPVDHPSQTQLVELSPPCTRSRTSLTIQLDSDVELIEQAVQGPSPVLRPPLMEEVIYLDGGNGRPSRTSSAVRTSSRLQQQSDARRMQTGRKRRPSAGDPLDLAGPSNQRQKEWPALRECSIVLKDVRDQLDENGRLLLSPEAGTEEIWIHPDEVTEASPFQAEEAELRALEEVCRKELAEAEKAVHEGFQSLESQRSARRLRLATLRADLLRMEEEERSGVASIAELVKRKEELESLLEMLFSSRMRAELELRTIESNVLKIRLAARNSSGEVLTESLEEEESRALRSEGEFRAVQEDENEVQGELDSLVRQLAQEEESQSTLNGKISKIRTELEAKEAHEEPCDAQTARILAVTELKDRLAQIAAKLSGLQARRVEAEWLERVKSGGTL